MRGGGVVGVRLSRLPRSSIFYILDKLMEEDEAAVMDWFALKTSKSYQDFDGWIKSLEAKAGEEAGP
jgi:hypothetical protein